MDNLGWVHPSTLNCGGCSVDVLWNCTWTAWSAPEIATLDWELGCDPSAVLDGDAVLTGRPGSILGGPCVHLLRGDFGIARGLQRDLGLQ